MMRMKSSSLPIVLGLSFCGVAGAFYLIYLRSQKKSDTAESSNKEKADEPLAAGEGKLEFVVKSYQVPLIVGRNSVTVKKIEETTNTRVTFREKDDESFYCLIEGPEQDIPKAKKLIDIEINRPQIETDEIFIETKQGKVVGLSGDAQVEIVQKSKAKIWVDEQYKKRYQGKRRVLVTGTREQIDLAKQLIEENILNASTLDEEQPLQSSPSVDTSTSSIHTTEHPREIYPSAENLRSTSQDGQLEVYVVNIINPSKFYVQIVGPQSADLDILVQEMTDYYNKDSHREFHKLDDVSLGQIVAAQFKFDSKWYRAEIVKVMKNDFNQHEVVYDLFFVDYGDRQYVQKNEMFELRTDFLSLRFQAIECYLANVMSLNHANDADPDEWDTKAIDRFEELTHVAQWKKLIAKVVGYKERPNLTAQSQRSQRESSPIPGIELYDYTDGADRNIAQVLIEEGCVGSSQFGDLQKSSVLNIEDDETAKESAKTPAQTISEVSESVNDVTPTTPNDFFEKYPEKISPKPESLETIEESPINIDPPVPEIPAVTVKVPVAPVPEKSLGLPTILERNEFDTKSTEPEEELPEKVEEKEPEKKLEEPESVPVLEPEKKPEEEDKQISAVEPETISVAEPEKKTEIKEENVSEVVPETKEDETDGEAKNSMEFNGTFKPENVPERNAEPNLPVNSFNGNLKKTNRNKKKVLNDFLSNERGNTSTKSQRAGKLKGEDWNDLMDE